MDYRVIVIVVIEAALALMLPLLSGAVKGKLQFAAAAVIVFLAFFIRLAYLDHEDTDYQWFLTRWVDFYAHNGGFAGLKESVGNYNIPYLYFLAAFSYSTVRDLYLIKLLSMFFDVILAYSCMRIAEKCGCVQRRCLICYLAALLLPTVIINGAVWGQCDSIYVSFAMLGLLFALDERPALSIISIAVSFGFKLQAVFIMPVYIILWHWKRYKWITFALFPLSYLVLILPAVFTGRPLRDAVMLYADQAGTVGSGLNYNAPSLTAFFRNVSDTAAASKALIVCAFAAMLLLMLAGIILRRRMTERTFLCLCLLMVTAIPFLLPHMHDRYFFFTDILTLILAFCIPPASPAALFAQFASLICYIAHLQNYYMRLGRIFLTADRGAAAEIFILLLAAFFFVRELHSKQDKEKSCITAKP